LRTPGSTTAVRAKGSIALMRLSLASTSSTAPSIGSAPAASPVPAPRATTAIFSAWHSRRIAATCASFSGSTTTSGMLR
jgi:hypothetical protein